MTEFYAYVYHDGPTPIYVGKGCGNRAYGHLKESHNNHLNRKLAKMKREGREPYIQIIDAPDEDAAYEMEELLVTMIGRQDLGTGPLLNKDGGGKGGTRFVGPETRKKLGHMKDKKRPEHSSHMKEWFAKNGNPMSSPEAIAKGLQTRKTVIWSNGHITNIKPCTVDGVKIYPSRKALAEDLGWGKAGARSPNFRYVEKS